jgi:hypothetical protein
MEWFLIYLMFSGMFTFGVSFKNQATAFEFFILLFLSIISGWVVMPFYIGMWLDVNDQSDNS